MLIANNKLQQSGGQVTIFETAIGNSTRFNLNRTFPCPLLLLEAQFPIIKNCRNGL